MIKPFSSQLPVDKDGFNHNVLKFIKTFKASLLHQPSLVRFSCLIYKSLHLFYPDFLIIQHNNDSHIYYWTT